MKRLMSLMLGTLLSLSAPALAGEAVELATQAESEAAKGDTAAAIETMRKALLTVWEQSPLAIRRAELVQKKATGFGIFDARADKTFKQNEEILVYVEPVGYGWSEAGGIYRSDMTADFELRTPQGRILAGQKGFGRFNLASRIQNTEYFINLTYRFTGLPPGEYLVGTTLHDNILGKSVSFDMPFQVE